MENNEKEEELTEEQLAAMDSLFGFGGCDCSHCDQGCHDDEAEDSEEEVK